jgi:hypothetical protein
MFLVPNIDRILVVLGVMNDLEKCNSRESKRKMLIDHIKPCITEISDNGRKVTAHWSLGALNSPFRMDDVCRQCFLHYYQFGSTLLVDICNDIKKGEDKSADPDFSDRAGKYRYSETFKNALDDLARKSKINLDHHQIAAMQIPNTPLSLMCFG